MLVTGWHLLSDPEGHFIDLGPDHYDTHLNTSNKNRYHVRPTRSPRPQSHPRTAA